LTINADRDPSIALDGIMQAQHAACLQVSLLAYYWQDLSFYFSTS
jgi:hypothetical protein